MGSASMAWDIGDKGRTWSGVRDNGGQLATGHCVAFRPTVCGLYIHLTFVPFVGLVFDYGIGADSKGVKRD